MTRKYFFNAIVAAIMMMVSANTFAQGYHYRDSYSRHNRGAYVTRSYDNHRGYRVGNRHRRHVVVPVATRAPRLDARGYVPGWEGRVRYLNGRWGYYRDANWLWYDSYFDPVYYYGHPIAHFRGHLTPAEKVAAAAVGTAALGAVIAAICH